MRIDISTSSNLNKTEFKKINNLKEGDVIKAKIIEVNGNVAKIDLGNGEIVYGKLDVPFSLLKDKTLNFVIKDIKDNLLLMSPVYEDIDFSSEFVLKNKNLIMDRILNLSNLGKDEKNLNIIKAMIAQRMPLDAETIEKLSNYTDKLISLLNLTEGDELQTVSSQNPLDQDIGKLIKVTSLKGGEESPLVREQLGQEATVKNQRSDLTEISNNKATSKESEALSTQKSKNDEFKSISIDFLNKNKLSLSQETESLNLDKLVTPNKVESKDSSEAKITDLKELLSPSPSEQVIKLDPKETAEKIKLEIKNIFPEKIELEDVVKKLTFLLKSNIEVSVKNLARLQDFLENHHSLNKDILEVADLALKENIIDVHTKEEIVAKTKTIDLKFDGQDNKKLNEFFSELKEVTEKVIEQISPKAKENGELSTKLKDLNENIDFLNKINDKSTMMLIPFTLENKQIENSLYVLSKRKVSKRSDNIKVYMALNTNNLDKVKIFCDFSYDRLDVNFKVREEYMTLFEQNKEELKAILESNGYTNTFVYVNKEENENILDMISYDDTINYMLNVKV